MGRSIAALALVPLLLTGCLRPQQSETVRYRLDVKILPEAAPHEQSNPPSCTLAPRNTGLVLAVRPIETSRAYGVKIAYRDEGYELGHFETAEWAELPEVMVGQALRDALVYSGRFADVARAGDVTRPDATLTADLRTFELDTTTRPWTARVTLIAEVREAPGRDLWVRVESQTMELLAADSVSALPEAMSKALTSAATGIADRVAAAAAEHSAEEPPDGESL